MQALLAEEERAAAARAQQSQRKVGLGDAFTLSWSGLSDPAALKEACLLGTPLPTPCGNGRFRFSAEMHLLLSPPDANPQAAKRQARKLQQDAAAAAATTTCTADEDSQATARAAAGAAVEPETAAEPAAGQAAEQAAGASVAEQSESGDDGGSTSDATTDAAEAASLPLSLPGERESVDFVRVSRRSGSKPGSRAISSTGGSSTPELLLSEAAAEAPAEEEGPQQEQEGEQGESLEESDEQLAWRLQVGGRRGTWLVQRGDTSKGTGCITR